MRTLFEQRLTDPTAEEVTTAHRQAIAALNGKQKTGIHSLSERDGELLGQRSVEEREGKYAKTRPEVRRVIGARRVVGCLSLVWWTSPAGRKLVRVRGQRNTARLRGPGTDEADYRRNEQLDHDRRPPVWHLDPERVFEFGCEGESEWIVACGCGAVGLAQSLGWQHGMCSPCADRVAEFGPDAVAHPPGLLDGSDFEPHDVLFTPDGRAILATSDDQYRVWDAFTGADRGGGACPVLDPPFPAMVSPDGRFAALGASDGAVPLLVLSVDRLESRGYLGRGGLIATRWTGRPGELLVQTAERGALFLDNVVTGEVSQTVLPPDRGVLCALWPDTDAPRAVFVAGRRVSVVRIGPDGTLAAEVNFLLGGGDTNLSGVWEGGPFVVRFTPNGERLLFARDAEMELWDLSKPAALFRATFPQPILDAAFSPDGEHLFILGADGAISVCDPATLTSIRARLRWHIGPVSRLAVSPDGQTLATAGAEGVKLWPVGQLMALSG